MLGGRICLFSLFFGFASFVEGSTLLSSSVSALKIPPQDISDPSQKYYCSVQLHLWTTDRMTHKSVRGWWHSLTLEHWNDWINFWKLSAGGIQHHSKTRMMVHPCPTLSLRPGTHVVWCKARAPQSTLGWPHRANWSSLWHNCLCWLFLPASWNKGFSFLPWSLVTPAVRPWLLYT
jgi:hypothetical protein